LVFIGLGLLAYLLVLVFIGLGSLAYILVLVFIGIGLRFVSLRVLKNPLRKAIKLLNVFTIWVILPSVVFISVGKYTGQEILGFGNALVLGVVGVGFSFVSAVVVSHIAKDDRKDTMALALNSGFMNVTHLGLPAVYVLIGQQYLGPAALYAMGVGVLHLIFGTMLASLAAKRKITARSVILNVVTFPAAFALIAALLFVAFQAPVPTIIQNNFNQYLAPLFFSLMLVAVGSQIPLVSPRKYLDKLFMVGAFRFVLCPLVTFLLVVVMGLGLVHLSPKPAVIMSAMPPAVFNMILAHNYKLDTKLYGALIFYLTLISLLVVLPIVSLFIL
jgi:predicted permease